MTFRGQVALITGAASGMGQLSAWRLAAEGVQVAALDVDAAGLERTARRAPSVTPMVCDVTDRAAVDQAVAHVEAELGPIDRVTNAAGIAPTAPLIDQDLDVIRRIMEVNYFGTVHVTRAVLPAMLERGFGDLVNYASLAGWLPSYGFGAYNASKFAVVAFTEVLAHEIAGRGVRVACVCPPIVDTPLLAQVSAGARELIDSTPAIRPEVVLDAIEVGIDRGDLFIWPDAPSRIAQLVRRVAPSLLWKRMDQVRAVAAAGSGAGHDAADGASAPAESAAAPSPGAPSPAAPSPTAPPGEPPPT